MAKLSPGEALKQRRVLANFYHLCFRQSQSAVERTERPDGLKRSQQKANRNLKGSGANDHRHLLSDEEWSDESGSSQRKVPAIRRGTEGGAAGSETIPGVVVRKRSHRHLSSDEAGGGGSDSNGRKVRAPRPATEDGAAGSDTAPRSVVVKRLYLDSPSDEEGCDESGFTWRKVRPPLP